MNSNYGEFIRIPHSLIKILNQDPEKFITYLEKQKVYNFGCKKIYSRDARRCHETFRNEIV